jgi:hypothetical protein
MEHQEARQFEELGLKRRKVEYAERASRIERARQIRKEDPLKSMEDAMREAVEWEEIEKMMAV